MDEFSRFAKQLYLERVRIQGNLLQEEVNDTITDALDHPVRGHNMFPELFEDRHPPKLCFKLVKYPEIVAVAEAFDIVYDAHVKCKHGDLQLTYDYLKNKFLLPRTCVQWVVESCSFCNPQLNVDPALSGTGEWRLSLIQPFEDIHVLDPSRRTVIIFKEDKSNFLQLRPIKNPITQESLVQVLTTFFIEFGYPERIIVTEDFELFERCFFQIFKSNNGTTPRVRAELSTNCVFEDDKEEVMKELGEWAHNAEAPLLDIGCYMIQYKMNTSRKYLNSLRSREEFLGVPLSKFFLKNEV